MSYRIGHGFDVHKFSPTKDDAKVIICGVHIPFECELVAHSDGDVALHALSDALLGAANLGDIGKYFPDTDLKYKGIGCLFLFALESPLLSDWRLRRY